MNAMAKRNLGKARQYMYASSRLLQDRVNIGDSVEPYSVLLAAAVPYRITTLVKLGCELYERDELIGAAVIARSALETVILLVTLGMMLKATCRSRDIEELHKKAEILALGIRCSTISDGAERNGRLPPAINILTLFDNVDKHIPNMRKCYDMLSEICHPNGLGILGIYANISRSKSGNIPIGRPSHIQIKYLHSLIPTVLRVSAAKCMTETAKIKHMLIQIRNWGSNHSS